MGSVLPANIRVEAAPAMVAVFIARGDVGGAGDRELASSTCPRRTDRAISSWR